jgi:hypothetical protein
MLGRFGMGGPVLVGVAAAIGLAAFQFARV